MSQVQVPLPQLQARPDPFAKTSRTDTWWVQPLLVFLGFSAFIVYSTWAALQGNHYWVEGTRYLSPMYSPVLWDAWQIAPASSGHALFGPWPEWFPKYMLLPLTPAFLILWVPGGFRFTCYYYRGAYYKAFWADPLSCSVGEPKFRGTKYRGEKKFPLTIQNIHRYFLYLAIIFVFLLSYDAALSYFFPVKDAAGAEHLTFGIGIGSLVLTINPILLGLYTFGCHSLRHLIGGRKDHLSGLGPAKKAYDCVSCLNRKHMMWAWLSLFWVGFTDVYVRMVSMGVFTDFRIL